LTIKWAYNTYCEGHEKRGNFFVIEVRNIFDIVLLKDTISGFKYLLKPEFLDSKVGLTLFYVREIGTDEEFSIGLKTINSSIQTTPDSSIETLNAYLLNGYFLNALTIVDQLKRPDLEEELSKQYKFLFPANFPNKRNYFNSYLVQDSSELIIMPYVNGLDSFIKTLNNSTKSEYIKGDPIDLNLLISPNNQIISFDINLTVHKDLILALISDLTFVNRLDENARVLIKISKTESGKMYEIANERALLDPDSKQFKKNFKYQGAVN
jgi:hypothetical protein